ncbi:MAG: MHYT domain-containing protein [Sulfurisoma sp.]|nr:MHYT domain-containing protein [Sulfurisoma sp.]
MNGIIDTYLHLVATPPADSLLFLGTYSPGLVVLSIGIAIFASYTALLVADFAERSEGARTKQMLLTLGGLALGAGIWSMHFVGMLGFALPCGVSYDPWVTGFSMIPGVLASIFSLHLISQRRMDWKLLLIGGTLFGAGVGVMHYAGMAAMRMGALLRYDVWLFFLSIIVAVVLAILALWIRTGIVRLLPGIGQFALLVSAIVMGGAVSGMHYTAMAAAYFVRDGDTKAIQAGFEPLMLAIVIAGVTGLLIGVVLIYVFRHFLHEMEQVNAQSKLTLSQLQGLVAAHEQNVWIKSSSAQINAALQSKETIADFARQLMLTLTPLLGAQVGVFYYRAPGTTHYRLLGSHAYQHRKGLTQQFAVGEGLVGQCVVERAPISVSGLDQDYIQIASGLGQTSPRFLLAAPLKTVSGDIPGVIEVASLARFGEREQALLDEILPMIALSITALERNNRTRELLDESQHQQNVLAEQAQKMELLAQRDGQMSLTVGKGL